MVLDKQYEELDREVLEVIMQSWDNDTSYPNKHISLKEYIRDYGDEDILKDIKDYYNYIYVDDKDILESIKRVKLNILN